MSCQACDDIQEGRQPMPGEYYVRVGTANVLVVACPLHAGMTVGYIHKGQASDAD